MMNTKKKSTEQFLKEKKTPLINTLITPEMTGSTPIEETPYNDIKIEEKAPEGHINREEAQDEVDELEQMFSGDGQTESSILKELFSNKNIKLKTDLSADEVSIISRLELMSDITKRPYLKIVLNEFRVHRVSKERKSRGEFVEAHRDRQKNMGAGLLGGLLGGGGQGGAG